MFSIVLLSWNLILSASMLMASSVSMFAWSCNSGITGTSSDYDDCISSISVCTADEVGTGVGDGSSEISSINFVS